MAKVGDTITWGTPDSPIFFSVGYSNELEQIVDTLNRDDWLAQEIYVRYGDYEVELLQDVAEGRISRDDMSYRLSQLVAEIHSEAGVLFYGDEPADTWLARYAIEAYELQGWVYKDWHS